jgi:hypothetical protein
MALPDGGGEPSSLMLSKAPGLVKRAIAYGPHGADGGRPAPMFSSSSAEL